MSEKLANEASTMTTFEALPLLLTIEELQKIMSISRPSAYNLAHQRGFPSIRIGKSLRVPKFALIDWVNRQAANKLENKPSLVGGPRPKDSYDKAAAWVHQGMTTREAYSKWQVCYPEEIACFDTFRQAIGRRLRRVSP